MVGRALIERLRREGYQTIVAPSSAELDLRDQAAVHRFFADNRFDRVFHLAGHIGGIGASAARGLRQLLGEPGQSGLIEEGGCISHGRPFRRSPGP